MINVPNSGPIEMTALKFAPGALLLVLLTTLGCTETAPQPATSGKATTSTGNGTTTTTTAKPEFFKPVTLGSGTTTDSDSDANTASVVVSDEPPEFEEIVAGLKPIQIMLGKWQGILSKSSTNEVHDWAWDLQTDPEFPALVAKSENGRYFRELRLTYDPRIDKYLMTTIGEDGESHKFEGNFLKEPEDVPSDDGKTVHREFKLELTEIAAEGARERWQYTFNQQHNNRYLVDVKRARGKSVFQLRDTIGSQREGVSFARADDDYGDRACVISGGLGTSTVSFNGKSYYVCCSGCAAAFNDDPERWIARFEAQKAEKMKAKQ
jgi:hypothetical protein